MNTISLQIQDEALRRALKQKSQAARDIKEPLREFSVYMGAQIALLFERLSHGGQYRGVVWKYFAPQYVRKDGTVVPAWGGVPRVRGLRYKRSYKKKGITRGDFRKPNVLGRKRPSGARVKQGDAILQDVGTLKARAALVQRLRKDRLEMGPSGGKVMKYAAAQHARRPWLFFHVPEDSNYLLDLVRKHLRKGDA